MKLQSDGLINTTSNTTLIDISGSAVSASKSTNNSFQIGNTLDPPYWLFNVNPDDAYTQLQLFHYDANMKDDAGNTIEGNNLKFVFERTAVGAAIISFTASHQCTYDKPYSTSDEGLIVMIDSSKPYFNINEQLKPSISDSIPHITTCNIEKSKKVIGVLSGVFSGNCTTGAIQSPIDFIYKHHERVSINSIGEGGIWVCNKYGTFECGDLITSTSVPGYGAKQDNEFLCNYTVGKITCDCDFSLSLMKKQKVLSTIIDSSGDTVLLYSDEGNIQYEDEIDEDGNPIYEYKFNTRFLLHDGTILENENEYMTRKHNGEEVYISCFVGCIYYCG
jgi:hypothetical protein